MLQPGDVISDRFEIDREAGSGGMGIVYRALDRLGSGPVAVKVLHAPIAQAARFDREALLLAELAHPAIVRYVAHGVTAAGAHYIALEWLEGEDLTARLARTGVTVAESVTIVQRVAEALAVAHARAVVHRDLKPSNLYLVGGRPEAVKLLDFGIARITTTVDTQTGTVLGTPAYMAPEQARGDRGLDARADVFSLGAVLFECLTGRSPFVGDNVMAVLAKILLEEAPRVRSIRPDVPPVLDDLVARMLSKDPEARPRNGAAVVAAVAQLGSLGDLGDAERGPPSTVAAAITTSEQRLLTIVLGVRPEPPPATRDATAPTIADEGGADEVRALASAHGLSFASMLGRSWLATVGSKESARDQAARAARCALALRAASPRSVLAIATGRGMAGERWPIGEVIDRASAIVQRAGRRTTLLEGEQARPVRIDEISAGLLDATFVVSSDRDGLFVAGERAGAPRTLLGRRTPLVGRDRELLLLTSLLDECVGERVARVLLLVGESGMGKSRLLQEFVERVKGADPGAQVWSGRADSISAGSPFGLLGSAIRGAFGLVEAPIETWRGRIADRVARHVAAADARRVAEFIGELVGAPFPEDASVELRAARADAVLLGDQMRRAWVDLVAAECSVAPLVLVLEDLQWGDLSTVRFVDAALRGARELPLLVVAAARPEVRDLFPALWRDRGMEEVRVGELSPSAAKKLVRQVLGARATPEVVERIVARAGGHALYLEELMRATAESSSDELPPTVLAMVEARIEALEAVARRVLRAASVFGEAFWLGGVRALLGDLAPSETLAWLAELVKREHLVERAVSSFPGEQEYAFRHSILRDAAYGMLPERDRASGHRLAATWLEAAGERDPVVLAGQFERGGEPARAIAGWRRAAEEALRGDDFDDVLARVERAVACGAAGEELGALRLLEAQAFFWRGDSPRMEVAADEALRLLPAWSPGWLRAQSRAIVASTRLGRTDRLFALADDFLAHDLGAEITPAFVDSATECAVLLLRAGRTELADALLARLAAAAAPLAEREPAVAAHIHRARAWRELYAGDDLESLVQEEAAAEGFRRAGDLRNECRHRSGVAYQRMLLGDYAGADRDFVAALVSAEGMGLLHVVAEIKHNHGLVLARLGRLEEGLAAERRALELVTLHPDDRMAAGCRKYLAMLLLEAGQVDEAERLAREAVGFAGLSPTARAHLESVLANVLRARGEIGEALEAATRAMDLLREIGIIEEGEIALRLAYVQALEASGDREGAKAALLEARAVVLVRADKIKDPVWRSRFLEAVPECAETLRLAALA